MALQKAFQVYQLGAMLKCYCGLSQKPSKGFLSLRLPANFLVTSVTFYLLSCKIFIFCQHLEGNNFTHEQEFKSSKLVNGFISESKK